MIWVGLPQLLVFPFVPRLMRRFDLRVLVCFGSLVFAGSCSLNTSMSPDYAGDQFIFANVIRALGQPFTIVPLSALATSLLLPKDAGDGSAVFNIARKPRWQRRHRHPRHSSGSARRQERREVQSRID